jgi:phage-related protein
MPKLAFYWSVWDELQATEDGLRGRCKAFLHRLANMRPGEASGLRLEKVNDRITELKISWNKQEFRLLLFNGPNNTAYIVHFFQKKTKKTPPREIDLALSRRQEVLLECATIVTRTLQ